jgi:hypothetical protein
MTVEHIPHLECVHCNECEVFTNGDTDCCSLCGGTEYNDISDLPDPIKPINASEYLNDMFGSWVPIFGGKQ